jgi:hypothetical protein
MKQEKESETFQRFEAVRGHRMLKQMLAARRQADAHPKWRPTWMESPTWSSFSAGAPTFSSPTVLVPGAMAPKLISQQTVKAMKPSSVIVDVAIDQDSCAENSRPMTHSNPTYDVVEVVHYPWPICRAAGRAHLDLCPKLV